MIVVIGIIIVIIIINLIITVIILEINTIFAPFTSLCLHNLTSTLV